MSHACDSDPPALEEIAASGFPVGFYLDQAPHHERVAYLTFDDGPGGFTAEILDILAEEEVPATFFVNACSLKGALCLTGWEEVLARILDEGHALGNHTLDHRDMKAQTAEQIAWALDHNEFLVNKALRSRGFDPVALTLVRPPFGSPWTHGSDAERSAVGAVVARRGVNVLWNVNSTDSNEWVAGEWHSRTPPAGRSYDPSHPAYRAKVARLVRSVLEDDDVRSGRGVIVLMHDIHPTTRDALPDIIAGLRADGYRFETVEHAVEVAYGTGSARAAPECTGFAEVPGSLCGRLRTFWQEEGGLPVFGLPLGEMTLEQSATDGRTYHTQWFERNRLEMHPENDAPYKVLLGQLGGDRLAQLRVNRDAPPFAGEAGPRAGCRWFPETRHNVCDEGTGFLAYYQQNGLAGGGSLALFGYPLSSAHRTTIDGNSIVVQWFERARMELHPGVGVLLGRLGAEVKGLP